MPEASSSKAPAPTTSSSGIFQGASPKLTFIFGIITGICVTAIVAFFIILNTGTTKKVANTTTNTNTNTEPTYSNVAAVSSDDYVRGDANAKLTLIEYSDLECPYCKNFHPTMKQIMTDYAGRVRWVFRHFPLSFHANAQKEAEASLCVGKLGGAEKYWNFLDKVYERTAGNGTGFALTDLGPLAKEVGVNQTSFQKCLDDGEMASRVSTETTDGSNGGASGTPTTFLVDKDGNTITAIPGALPIAQVKAALDQALAQL